MFKFQILNEAQRRKDPSLEDKLHGSDSLPLMLSIRSFFRIAVPYWKGGAAVLPGVFLRIILGLT